MKNIHYSFIYFLIIGFGFIFPNVVQAAWFDNDWSFRVPISSNNAVINSTETDVPLLVDLSQLPNEFFSEVLSNGADIVVTTDDGVTQLDRELVELDISGQKGELYIKAPNLDNSSETDFYIYFGNIAGAESNSPNVWNDYRAVWHFNEDLGTTPQTKLGVASISAMDGGDGGWATWFGDTPIGALVKTAIDEDQITDAERAHTTEQVSYWIFDTETNSSIKNTTGNTIGEVVTIDGLSNTFSSINLQNTYTDPVIVAIPVYESGAAETPSVVRLDNISSTTFDIRLQNPGDLVNPSVDAVHYIALEKGSHILPGNTKIEAGTETISGVNTRTNWTSAQMNLVTPLHSYINPVVLGSVQTQNDSLWSTFWSSNGTQTNPANSGNIYVGRHVGADTTSARLAEDIGYIIIEQSTGSTNGISWKAGLGPDTVGGVTSSPPYTYSGFTSVGANAGPFLDSTVNGFHAGYIGNVMARENGQVGYAVETDGNVGSYLPIQGLSYTNNNNLNELTASLWLKTTDTARSGIFDFDRSEHWELGLNFHNASGKAGTVSFDTAASVGGIRDMNSSQKINDGTWQYVTVVFDEANTQDKKIYINGVLDSEVNQHTTGLGRGTTRFGFFADGSEAAAEGSAVNNIPYQGFIDEARLQHRSVDADWIKTTYENLHDNNNFWDVDPVEEQNITPDLADNLYFNHTNAQIGDINPTDVAVYGSSSYIPYFSAIYQDQNDGDIANRAYIQVSTDSSFSTIDYWDSGWFTLATPTVESSRSIDIEYGSVGNAAIQTLAMNDGVNSYYWRIAFEDDSSAQGIFSAPATFTLLDTPNLPNNVSALKIDGSPNPDTFDITWLDTSLSETSFEVQFKENTGTGFGSWTDVTSPSVSPTPANTTLWSFDGTVNNAEYMFQVRSCNYSGCSAWVSDPFSHFTDPDAPVEVCAAYVNDTEFNLGWKNRAIFNQTTLEQCNGSVDCTAGTFSNVITSAAAPPPFISSNATNTDEIYRWGAYADNGSITSDPTYSTFEYTSPAAPSVVSAVRISDTLIQLSWIDNSQFEDGFRIYVSKDGGSFNEVTPGLNTTSANATNYTFNDAQSNSSYVFEVRAHIAPVICSTNTNTELLSTAASSSVVYTTPDAPSFVTGNYISDSNIDIYWTDNSQFEDGFNIYVREDNGAWNLDTTVTSNITSHTFNGGVANHSYDFYVESIINVSVPENPIELKEQSPVSFGTILTTPTAPILSIDTISSTSIDWNITDTADYEIGFNTYDGVPNLTQTIPFANVSGWSESSLVPNTEYERTVRSYVENNGGAQFESINSNTITAWTLANSPGNPLASEITPGVIDISWDGGTNPLGTEYNITNTTTTNTSGWTTDLFSFSESGLACGTLYEYAIKARNNDSPQIETGTELIEIETAVCPSDNKASKKRIITNTNSISDSIPLGTGEQCSSEKILSQNLKAGARNGKFHSYTGETVYEVKILQEHMNRLGFNSGTVDGILGPLTDSAIKRMQAYLGTPQDGYVGPKTRALINSSCVENEIATPEPIPIIENAKCYINYTRLIRQGMIGDDIKQAQECIASLGHPTGPFDGIYGGLTYAGVRSYQKSNNLILDGIIGPETAGHLNALSEVALDGITSL